MGTDSIEKATFLCKRVLPSGHSGNVCQNTRMGAEMTADALMITYAVGGLALRAGTKVVAWGASKFGRVSSQSAQSELLGTFEVGNFSAKVENSTQSFFENTTYSPKVLRQASKVNDICHAFPKSVDGFATEFGSFSTKIGADGKIYNWLEMNGSYRNRVGTFEFIKDVDGIINHRYFNIGVE